MGKPRLKRATSAQLEEILKFVTKNKFLVHGKKKPSDLKLIKTMWDEFAVKINAKGRGPAKTGDQWKNVFLEWKSNAKRKSRIVRYAKLARRSEPSVKLNDIEERLLGLISMTPFDNFEVSDQFKQPEPTTIPDLEIVKQEDLCCETLAHPEPTTIPYVEIVKQEELRCETLPHPEPTMIPNVEIAKQEEPSCDTFAQFLNSNSNTDLQQKQVKLFQNLLDKLNSMGNEMLKIKKGKLKLEYFKIVGNFEGFEDFFSSL